MTDKDTAEELGPDDPALPLTEPDAMPSAETGPVLDLNVNGGDPIPEPIDNEED